MNKELGILHEIDVREIWAHEQYDFSQWLSSPENIKLLGDTLNLSLSDIETEKFVGSYRCDIICKDEITGKNVLIENQLESSNHDHLGKIITYASGLDATVVIWIVAEARKEHASAIEWLNQHTDENISFFLIEIHAFTIGDSKPAPQFKIVEQPNDFARVVKKISQERGLSSAETNRLEFWNMFNEIVEERKRPFNTHKPSTDHWYQVALGNSKCTCSIDLVNKDHRIRVQVWIPKNKELFDRLYSQKDTIEKEAGIGFEWDRIDGKDAARISIYIEGLDFENKSNYRALIDKVIDSVIMFRKIFPKYISGD